jgi:hypothetical protein
MCVFVCIYIYIYIFVIMFVKTTSVLEIGSLFTCYCIAIPLVRAVRHLAQLLYTHSLTSSLPARHITCREGSRMSVGNLCLPRHPISFLNIPEWEVHAVPPHSVPMTILSHGGVRWVLEWELDLSNSYNSWLQVRIMLSLFYTLHKSL